MPKLSYCPCHFTTPYCHATLLHTHTLPHASTHQINLKSSTPKFSYCLFMIHSGYSLNSSNSFSQAACNEDIFINNHVFVDVHVHMYTYTGVLFQILDFFFPRQPAMKIYSYVIMYLYMFMYTCIHIWEYSLKSSNSFPRQPAMKKYWYIIIYRCTCICKHVYIYRGTLWNPQILFPRQPSLQCTYIHTYSSYAHILMNAGTLFEFLKSLAQTACNENTLIQIIPIYVCIYIYIHVYMYVNTGILFEFIKFFFPGSMQW